MSAAVEAVLAIMYPLTREPDGTATGDHQRQFATDIVKVVLRHAIHAVRSNAGEEDDAGICAGVSTWPRDRATAYSVATYEAIEAIEAIAEAPDSETGARNE